MGTIDNMVDNLIDEPTSSNPTDGELYDEQGREQPERDENGRRRRGAPRGGFDRTIDWRSIEKDYLYGWETEGSESDPLIPPIRHFPTMRELGDKYGVHHSLIGRKAKQLEWRKRRKQFKEALNEETDRAIAKAAALSTADAVALIDKWIGRWEANLRQKRVRADNVNDLDKILRLREFLLGNADQRSETNHVVSLDAMQQRYADQRAERVRRGELNASPALAGVLADGDAAGDPVAAMGGEGIAESTQKQQSSNKAS